MESEAKKERPYMDDETEDDGMIIKD
jgi:hypothetical protein